MSLSDYDKYAEIYDLDLGNVEKDVKVYKEIIKENSSVLILSCGTGREIMYLSEYCTKIAGLDLSQNMINKAREKNYHNKPVKFYIQDMTNFKLEEKYDYIIIPNNGLLHLLDHDSVERCFECVSKYLNKSGKLLFDFFLPMESNVNNSFVVDYHRYFKKINKEVIRSRMISRNHLTRINKTKVFYEFISEDGSVEKKVVSYTLKNYYPDEVKLLSRVAGFCIDNIYGGFNLEEYDEEKHYHVFFEMSLNREKSHNNSV